MFQGKPEVDAGIGQHVAVGVANYRLVIDSAFCSGLGMEGAEAYQQEQQQL
jgi:hypothetical protein